MARGRILGGLVAGVGITALAITLFAAPKPTVKKPALKQWDPANPYLYLVATTGRCMRSTGCIVIGHKLGLGTSKLFVVRSDGTEVELSATNWRDEYVQAYIDEAPGTYYLIAELAGGARTNKLLVEVVAKGSDSADVDSDGQNKERDCYDFDRHTGWQFSEHGDRYDNDCDPYSVSPLKTALDQDGDGFYAATACNGFVGKLGDDQFVPRSLYKPGDGFDQGGEVLWACGTDCRDDNAAIHPGEMVCGSDGLPYTCSSGARIDTAGLGVYADLPGVYPMAHDPLWQAGSCGAGMECVTQPNGTGTCAKK